MKKWKIIGLVILGLVLLTIIILGYLAYLGSQDIIIDNKNTELYTALVSIGIDDAVVDITEERILVSYNLLDLKNKEVYIYFIMGAAYKINPNTKQIIIVEFYELKPLDEITVTMDDVKLFAEEKITEEEFAGKLSISKLK